MYLNHVKLKTRSRLLLTVNQDRTLPLSQAQDRRVVSQKRQLPALAITTQDWKTC
ncbi:MAG: hypothetical protein IPG23_05040 [Burkholderiales bacterium]|jgi:hypothetical protein|nr:hypothetical protein [Burkholderiales bacterium]